MVKAGELGDIGGWGAGTSDLRRVPLVGAGGDRMAGYIKHNEMGA